MIGRMARAGELKERFTLGAFIAVDENHFVAAAARTAAADAVLAAGAETRVIGPGPIGGRRVAVILLHPRAHLALELGLEFAGGT